MFNWGKPCAECTVADQQKCRTILVKSAAKVTPLDGREPSCELLLLSPLREFFLMIPVDQSQHRNILHISFNYKIAY